MNRKKRIETILLNSFKNCKISIIDNSMGHKGHNNFNGQQESHFQIVLRKKSSYKKSTLSIHREINNLLKYEFLHGLHALEIKIILLT
jgi:BolA protein